MDETWCAARGGNRRRFAARGGRELVSIALDALGIGAEDLAHGTSPTARIIEDRPIRRCCLRQKIGGDRAAIAPKRLQEGRRTARTQEMRHIEFGIGGGAAERLLDLSFVELRIFGGKRR